METSHIKALVRKWMSDQGHIVPDVPDHSFADLTKEETEGRPTRLGLGARFIPHSQAAKLEAKIVRKILPQKELRAAQASGNSGKPSQVAEEDDYVEPSREDAVSADASRKRKTFSSTVVTAPQKTNSATTPLLPIVTGKGGFDDFSASLKALAEQNALANRTQREKKKARKQRKQQAQKESASGSGTADASGTKTAQADNDIEKS